MSSLYDKERSRHRKYDYAESMKSAQSDQSKPMEDDWYVRMMVKRLKWSGCEDKEMFILIFRKFWPDHRIANRAEEFYERALTFIVQGGE